MKNPNSIKAIIKDLKKQCNDKAFIKRIKKSDDKEEIAYLLYDRGFDEIVDSHYNIQEAEYYKEKWKNLPQRPC